MIAALALASLAACRPAESRRAVAEPARTAEGAAAAGAAPWGTVARKVEGGYLVSGRKIFASLAGAADWYAVLCTLERPGREGRGSRRDALYLAVPAGAPGV
ncbi:MAG: hypothetical protein KF795_28065, partial [Labilithrix sp.]|nr:hypothetical protein [Labilithrix sp.]